MMTFSRSLFDVNSVIFHTVPLKTEIIVSTPVSVFHCPMSTKYLTPFGQVINLG